MGAFQDVQHGLAVLDAVVFEGPDQDVVGGVEPRRDHGRAQRRGETETPGGVFGGGPGGQQDDHDEQAQARPDEACDVFLRFGDVVDGFGCGGHGRVALEGWGRPVTWASRRAPRQGSPTGGMNPVARCGCFAPPAAGLLGSAFHRRGLAVGLAQAGAGRAFGFVGLGRFGGFVGSRVGGVWLVMACRPLRLLCHLILR